MTMGTKANALHGPWEQVTYSGNTRQVAYFDSTGERANICEYWDEDYGDLLVKAWAVPQLMDLLQRLANIYDDFVILQDGMEGTAEVWEAQAKIGSACLDARALLERLS